MIIGFKVKNYKSFKDLQYLSMVPGKLRNKMNHISNDNILKFSSIHGANGSGKSNIVDALRVFKRIERGSINALYDNEYFKGGDCNKNSDSYFEYELCIDSKSYSYGFEINIPKKKIVSEWLIDMTKSKPKVIFERDTKNSSYNSDILNKNYQNYSGCLEEMRSNDSIFFLSEMNRRLVMSKNTDSYFDEVKNVYRFLTNGINIIRPESHKLIGVDYIKNKDKVIKIFKQLDINITDIIDEDSSINYIKSKLSEKEYNNIINNLNVLSNNPKYKNICLTLRIENDIYSVKVNNGDFVVKTLKFKHSGTDNTFGTYEESDGTIRILELIDALIANNQVFIIDEFDNRLHPLLIKGFIQIFLNNNNTNQLIITTHDRETLNFDLVRRDEVWFASKDEKGASNLYSLEEFKDLARFDKKIDKAYTEGRFGAIPNIKVEDEN